jgi:outer membrane protein
LRGAEEIAGSRVRAGLAPPIDENRAATRRMLQDVALADLEGQLHEATASLAVMLGIESEVVLTEAPEQRASLPAPVAELVSSARSERPELAAARARLTAQAAAVRMAKSAYYPQLSAYSLLQYGNNPALAGVGSRSISGAANPFSGMAGDFQAGVTLSMNFFDTLNTDHAVKDARYEESRLGLEIERSQRIVDSEVRTARARVVHYHDVRSKLSPALEIARDNVDIVQKRYENGEALVFELLDTQIELLNIERQLSDAAAELSLAWLELDASLGNVVGADSASQENK